MLRYTSYTLQVCRKESLNLPVELATTTTTTTVCVGGPGTTTGVS